MNPPIHYLYLDYTEFFQMKQLFNPSENITIF